MTPKTGLSRFIDLGEGPAPEVVTSEKDEHGNTHYDRIQAEFRKFKTWSDQEQLEKLGYPLSLYYDGEKDALTPLFYIGDRSMRESGYDPSDRFGRFNVDVVHYNAVDLNSLLYLYERKVAQILETLKEGQKAQSWLILSEERRERMQRAFWDEETGLFLDFNVRTQERRNYPFATTYFPLWTGWCTPCIFQGNEIADSRRT